MAAPHCLHSDHADSDVLLATLFPDLASLSGPVINEATFAQTVCRLLQSALSEEQFEPAAQRQDQPSRVSEPIRMGRVLDAGSNQTLTKKIDLCRKF